MSTLSTISPTSIEEAKTESTDKDDKSVTEKESTEKVDHTSEEIDY
jgi:hypothetical protein